MLKLDKSAWKRVAFGDVVTNRNDYFNRDRDGELPYVAGPHINPGGVSIERYGSTQDDDFPPTFKRLFAAGDVLLHTRGIEKIAVADRAGVTGEKLFVLRSSDPQVLDQRFLPWLLRSPSVARYLKNNFSGSVNKFLNWKPLAAMDFGLPPLDEQKRVADLLWAMEAHRRSLIRSIGAVRIVEARALDGAVGSDWPIKTVSDLGDVQLGQQLHPKYRSGPKMRKYLRVANVYDDQLDLRDVAEMDFSDRGAEKFRLETGDILLNEGQSIELVGRCAMYRGEIEDCYIQKTLLRFRSGPEILPDFALAWFRRCFLVGAFSALAKRTTSMAHLTAVRFAAMPMPCPSIEEQRRVVASTSTLKQARGALEGECFHLAALRAAVSVETFGELR